MIIVGKNSGGLQAFKAVAKRYTTNMPRGYNNDNYFARRQESESLAGDVALNIQEAMKDKIGPNTTVKGREARISSMDSGNPCGPGYEWIDAPQSSGKTRHRAQKCCYSIDKAMEVLVIIMRDDSMIMYDGVDSVLWDILKNYDSTHDFIEMYLDGTPWSKVTYAQLPRKRPEEFQLGIER